MKKSDWQKTLKQYYPEKHAKDYSPFRFVYAIKQTKKAILFKLKDHTTAFVPKSLLLIDRKGLSNIGKKDWIYLVNWFKMEIIKEHADKNLQLFD